MRKLFILMAVLALASCGKGGDEPSVEPSLSVEPVALSFTAQATESCDIVVTTNQSLWDAVSSQSWCTITKGNGKFTVRATANTSTSSPAPAAITVTAGTAKPVTINVTQAGVGAQLSVTPNSPVSFSSTGGEVKTITVTTNQSSWDVISAQTWCTVNKSGNDFTISASPNTGAESRNAVITVSANSAANVTIEVIQTGVGAQLSVSPYSPITFTSTGGASEVKTITVTTNQSLWNAISNQTWCTITKSGNQFTATASANTASTERTATITVSAGSAANVTIDVTQAGVVSAENNLKKAGFCLAYTIKITEAVKKGQKPTSISDNENKIILSTNYRPNGGLSYIDFYTYSSSSPLTTTTITEFSYNAPTSICAMSSSNSNTLDAAFDIGSGTYDFTNNPAKVMAYFGSFTGSNVFTSLSNLKLVANNDGITQEIYNKISFANNCYKIVVYGKNKKGKLIGRYVGYSTTGVSFTYWCIDPDDSSFGNSSNIAIP